MIRPILPWRLETQHYKMTVTESLWIQTKSFSTSNLKVIQTFNRALKYKGDINNLPGKSQRGPNLW